jgi:hypothetical protein
MVAWITPEERYVNANKRQESAENAGPEKCFNHAQIISPRPAFFNV